MQMYLTYVTVSKSLSKIFDFCIRWNIYKKNNKFRLIQRVAYASHGNFVIYGRKVHNRNNCALQNVTLKILKWFFSLYRLAKEILDDFNVTLGQWYIISTSSRLKQWDKNPFNQ